jgi:hypothetical protein
MSGRWPWSRGVSLPRKGNALPEMGNKIAHDRSQRQPAYAPAIAEARSTELEGSNHAIKMVMRWTGASERRVTCWRSEKSGPSGEHLIALLQNSDMLLERVLVLAGRRPLIERHRLEG